VATPAHDNELATFSRRTRIRDTANPSALPLAKASESC